MNPPNPVFAYWLAIIVNIAICIWLVIAIIRAVRRYKKQKREIKRIHIETVTITSSFETANYIRSVISALPVIYLETPLDNVIEFKVQGDAPVMQIMNRMLIDGALNGEWRQ